MQTAFWFCILMSGGLTLWVVYRLWDGRTLVRPLVVQNPTQDLGERETGVVEVIFVVSNPSRRTTRIIGFDEG